MDAGVEDTHGLLKFSPLDGNADVLDTVFWARLISFNADYSEELVLKMLHFDFDSFGEWVKEYATEADVFQYQALDDVYQDVDAQTYSL